MLEYTPLNELQISTCFTENNPKILIIQANLIDIKANSSLRFLYAIGIS